MTFGETEKMNLPPTPRASPEVSKRSKRKYSEAMSPEIPRRSKRIREQYQHRNINYKY